MTDFEEVKKAVQQLNAREKMLKKELDEIKELKIYILLIMANNSNFNEEQIESIMEKVRKYK